MFRILLVTFLESFATVNVERGVYFFCHDRLGFDDTANLWLALAFGAAYVVGALSSHRLCLRWKEKPLLIGTLSSQVGFHLILTAAAVVMVFLGGVNSWSVSAAIFVGSTALGFLNGVKWPIMESYVSAGKTPMEQSRVIGRYNISWSLSVPLALATVGPMIAHAPWSPSLFAIPALINLVSLWLVRPFPVQPEHLAEDHVERPTVVQTVRLEALLTSNRWLMLASYATLFLLAPLLPRIFETAGAGSAISPALSGLLDVVRLASFILLAQSAFWHGRTSPILASLVAMPAGFFLVLFGTNIPTVLAGELLFGLSAGVVYYGALYYAMVVKNASVAGGGAHEGLIGLGFAIGPAAGLLSVALQPLVHSAVIGLLIGTVPVLLICSIAACRPLLRKRIRSC